MNQSAADSSMFPHKKIARKDPMTEAFESEIQEEEELDTPNISTMTPHES
jgi:hypothetical protein